MPKKIEFEGAVHEFPDDFTDAEISQALSSKERGVWGYKDPVANAASKAWDVANTHAVKALGGATATEAYDAAGEGLKAVASKAFGKPYAQIRSELPFLKGVEAAGSVGRLAPQAIDAMMTPLGAAAAAGGGMLAKLPPALSAIPGALFGTASASELPGKFGKVLSGEASPSEVGQTVADTAMTALPFMAPALALRSKSKPRYGKQQDALLPKQEPGLPSAENYPVPFKSAQESATVFESSLPKLYPEVAPRSAAESAKVFDSVLAARERRAPPRAERRASVVPQDQSTVPESVLRAQDARRMKAKEVFQKPWEDLSNPERLLIDEALAGPPSGRERAGLPPPISTARRRNSQRGSVSGQPAVPKPKDIADDYLNFKRVNVSQEEEAALRAEIRGMAQRGELSKGVEPHSSIVERAKSIDPSLVDQVAAGEAPAGLDGRAAVFAMRQRINALNREKVALEHGLSNPALESEARISAIAKIDAMDKDLKQYIGSFAGIRTEQGRGLAALKIEADNTLDLSFWTAKAARAKGLPVERLPDADRSKIGRVVAEAQAAAESGDAAAASAAKMKLAKTAQEFHESGWFETATALWKAGLLTGIKTHLRNLGGNAAYQIAEEVARVPAALTDMALSLKTGQRTVAGPSVRGISSAGYEAATRGVREVGQIMRTGSSASDLAKGDMRRELNFQKLRRMAESMPEGMLKESLGKANDIVNTYTNSVFRALSAEDRMFRVYAQRRSIEGQAKVIALNEAKTGRIRDIDVNRRAIELADNPTPVMQTEAIAYGEIATFNNKNAVGEFMNRGKSALGPVGRAVVDSEVPFVNTPANVFARMLDYTPGTNMAPVAQAAWDRWVNQNLSANVQKTFSEAVGRGMVGTAVVYLAYEAARKGLMTGISQEQTGQRNVLQAANRPTGAIKVGDQWMKISPFSPMGTLATIGASLARESERSLKDEAKRPYQVASVVTRAMLEQPMLQGLKDTIETLENPGRRADSFMAQKAGSAVPTILADVATVVDPTRREIQPPTDASALGVLAHGVKGRLPLLRETLPVARDVFGRPLEGSRSAAVDPFLTTPAKEDRDPFLKALVNDEASVTAPRRLGGESSEHFRARKFLNGVAYEAAMRAVFDPGMTKEDREKSMKAARRQANRELKSLFTNQSFLQSSEPERARAMEAIATQLQATIPLP